MGNIFEKTLPTPNYRQMEWYSRGYTAFIHFGMNTFTDREWGDGTESPSTFNPSELDCRQWIRVLKEAGFGSAILTAKHHDGFCLWPSKYTEHSVKNSPFRGGNGDVVREFTDACREYGMKAGLYLSPWDRHEKTWGSDEYNDYYVNQLTELLSNYGKIHEIWWDGAGSTQAVYDWDRWHATVRTLQPDAVIFGSLGAAPYVDIRWVGNEKGYAGRPCWATSDIDTLVTEIRDDLNSGNINGEKFVPAEVDVSIRPGWFYHSNQDGDVRTPENLIYLWSSSIGRNSGLLLNLPPDRRGLIHERDVESVLKFKENIEKNLSINHAANAIASASSIYSDEYSPSNVLNDDRESFYAPTEHDVEPELTLKLDGKKRFNTAMLKEVLEYGHRIIEFEFYAKIDGEWKLLFANQCMGYKCVEHFEEVETDEVMLKIKKSRGVPLVNGISLYSFEGHIEPKRAAKVGFELMTNASVTYPENENSIDINFGGVYPFNTLSFELDGEASVEMLVFNGTRFEKFDDLALKSNTVCTLKQTVDYAYRIKLNVSGTPAESVKLSVKYEEK